MNNCRNCGAQVPPEKAWCPQCNEPVEAEARRTVEREIDSFAGTLIKKPKPRPEDVIPPAPAVPPPTVAQAAPVAPPPTPARGPETAANPAITTGPMSVIAEAASAPVSPPPTPEPVNPTPIVAAVPPPKADNSRLVIFVAVGLVLGLALLVVMIAVAIVLWNSSG